MKIKRKKNLFSAGTSFKVLKNGEKNSIGNGKEINIDLSENDIVTVRPSFISRKVTIDTKNLENIDHIVVGYSKLYTLLSSGLIAGVVLNYFSGATGMMFLSLLGIIVLLGAIITALVLELNAKVLQIDYVK